MSIITTIEASAEPALSSVAIHDKPSERSTDAEIDKTTVVAHTTKQSVEASITPAHSRSNDASDDSAAVSAPQTADVQAVAPPSASASHTASAVSTASIGSSAAMLDAFRNQQQHASILNSTLLRVNQPLATHPTTTTTKPLHTLPGNYQHSAPIPIAPPILTTVPTAVTAHSGLHEKLSEIHRLETLNEWDNFGVADSSTDLQDLLQHSTNGINLTNYNHVLQNYNEDYGLLSIESNTTTYSEDLEVDESGMIEDVSVNDLSQMSEAPTPRRVRQQRTVTHHQQTAVYSPRRHQRTHSAHQQDGNTSSQYVMYGTSAHNETRQHANVTQQPQSAWHGNSVERRRSTAPLQSHSHRHQSSLRSVWSQLPIEHGDDPRHMHGNHHNQQVWSTATSTYQVRRQRFQQHTNSQQPQQQQRRNSAHLPLRLETGGSNPALYRVPLQPQAENALPLQSGQLLQPLRSMNVAIKHQPTAPANNSKENARRALLADSFEVEHVGDARTRIESWISQLCEHMQDEENAVERRVRSVQPLLVADVVKRWQQLYSQQPTQQQHQQQSEQHYSAVNETIQLAPGSPIRSRPSYPSHHQQDPHSTNVNSNAEYTAATQQLHKHIISLVDVADQQLLQRALMLNEQLKSGKQQLNGQDVQVLAAITNQQLNGKLKSPMKPAPLMTSKDEADEHSTTVQSHTVVSVQPSAPLPAPPEERSPADVAASQELRTLRQRMLDAVKQNTTLTQRTADDANQSTTRARTTVGSRTAALMEIDPVLAAKVRHLYEEEKTEAVGSSSNQQVQPVVTQPTVTSSHSQPAATAVSAMSKPRWTSTLTAVNEIPPTQLSPTATAVSTINHMLHRLNTTAALVVDQINPAAATEIPRGSSKPATPQMPTRQTHVQAPVAKSPVISIISPTHRMLSNAVSNDDTYSETGLTDISDSDLYIPFERPAVTASQRRPVAVVHSPLQAKRPAPIVTNGVARNNTPHQVSQPPQPQVASKPTTQRRAPVMHSPVGKPSTLANKPPQPVTSTKKVPQSSTNRSSKPTPSTLKTKLQTLTQRNGGKQSVAQPTNKSTTKAPTLTPSKLFRGIGDVKHNLAKQSAEGQLSHRYANADFADWDGEL